MLQRAQNDSWHLEDFDSGNDSVGVRDNAVVGGKSLNLRIPGAIVAHAAVKQYQSLALSLLDAIKFDTINLDFYWLDALPECLRE